MKFKGKSFVWAALLLSLALVAAACGDGDDADTTVTTADGGGSSSAGEITGPIWVLLPDSASSDRWEFDDRRFFKEQFEAAGLSEGTDFTIVNAEGDTTAQLGQAEQAVADGASVVLLVELDSGSGAAIIDTLRDGGAQVINYDRLTIEGPGADLYVSFDNVQVGRTMAEIMTPVIDALAVDVPRIVMLNGGPEDNNATLFREGYNETVAAKVAAGEWELVADQAVPGWDNQEALTIMEQILVDIDNDVDAIFAANDGLGNSAAVAVENAGLGQVAISGQDATAAGMQNLLLGRQLMSVYKPIKAEAGVAAAAAIALRAGQPLSSVTSEFAFATSTLNNGTNDIPFFALTPIGVTKDNIAETVIADGFRTWEEICTGDVAALCPEDQAGGSTDAGPIWVLLPDSASSDRWEFDDRRFFKEQFEAAGLSEGTDFTIVNAEGDTTAQLGQAEQAVADGASVVLLVELDSGSGAAIIDTLRDGGAQVINYDRLTIEGPGADLYVSFDNVQVGRTMAEIMTPVIDALAVDVPRIVMLNGGPEDNNATLFREGYNETVAAKVAAGEWELVADQAVPGWDNQEALTIMEQILVDIDNDVDAIFAANDGLGNSAAVAVENAGLGQVAISGQDATAAGMQNLLLGRQLMSVYKPIKAEAGVAAAAAIALRAGQPLSSVTSEFAFATSTLNNGTNDIPFFALTPIGVTKDNIAETVIADGFRTWEEICVGDVAELCPAG